MATYFILMFGIIMIIMGRLMLKNWFTHLTIYSFIWTIVLSLNSLRLIKYNLIVPEAWVFIILAWVLLYVGSLTMILAKIIVRGRAEQVGTTSPHKEKLDEAGYHEIYFRYTIIILSVLGFIGAVSQWYWLFKQFGGLTQTLLSGYKLYSMRYHGELSEGIPYLTIMPISGSFFAGLYTGVRRRITFLALLPLLLVVSYSVGTMGRTPLLIAVVLFFSAYFLYNKYYTAKGRNLFTFRNIVIMTMILIFLTTAFDLIKVARSLSETFKGYGESKRLSGIFSIPFFSPSVYFYLTGPPTTFSEYLKAGGEDVPPGRYTLGTIYRFLSKFGMAKKYTYVQKFYFTPVPMNVATYLRELHADYREWGLTIFPFLLGLLCTFLYQEAHKKIWYVAIYSYLYVIIFMSFSYNIVSTGHWFINFFVTLFIMVVISGRIKQRKRLAA